MASSQEEPSNANSSQKFPSSTRKRGEEPIDDRLRKRKKEISHLEKEESLSAQGGGSIGRGELSIWIGLRFFTSFEEVENNSSFYHA